jgi:hypothetical protein
MIGNQPKDQMPFNVGVLLAKDLRDETGSAGERLVLCKCTEEQRSTVEDILSAICYARTRRWKRWNCVN